MLRQETDMSDAEVHLMALLCIATGVLSFALFVLPLFVAPRPWVWTYGLVLICFGLTSICCLPVCIPLLSSWTKWEVKRYYGKR